MCGMNVEFLNVELVGYRLQYPLGLKGLRKCVCLCVCVCVCVPATRVGYRACLQLGTMPVML